MLKEISVRILSQSSNEPSIRRLLKKTYIGLLWFSWQASKSSSAWTVHTVENVIVLVTSYSVRKVQHIQIS